MAAFPSPWPASQLTYNVVTTATNATHATGVCTITGNQLGSFAPPIQYVRSAPPVGTPLRMPPEEGIWISEKSASARPRKIIEVVCGSHVVCEGKRHSMIKWANLARYIEVDPPWDEFNRVAYDPLKKP